MRRPGLIFHASLLLLTPYFLFGCMTGGGTYAADEGGTPLKIVPAQITHLNAASMPGGHYVFNNPKEWDDFWTKHQKTPVPEVDFKRYTLVAVFLGQRPNPGYSVKIVGAIEHRDKVIVNVIQYLPSPEMAYVQVIVYPYDAVLIPKTKKEISFEVTQKVGQR